VLASCSSLLTLAVITLAAFGTGRPLVRAVRLAERDRLAKNLWSVVLGWVVLGLLWAGMGLAGLLYAPWIGTITLLACLWGAAELMLARQAAAVPIAAESAGDPPPVWLRRGMLGVGLAVSLAALVSALAPPTAGATLGCQLELSKTFLSEHALVYLPYQEHSRLPLLVEMWYLWGLALDGGVCAQLIHWEMAVLLALAAVVLATPVVGRGWAQIVGSLVLLTPDSLGVVFLAAIPGLLLCRRLRGLGTLLAVSAGCTLVWLVVQPDGHFFFPMIPALATAVVWVGIEIGRMPAAPRSVAATVLLGLIGVVAATAAARCRSQLGVALGLERRSDYLLRHEPTYEAAEVFNCLFDSRAHVLSQDECGFYFNCRVTREDVYRRLTRYDGQITNPLWLSRHLRQAGFSHVLLAEPVAAADAADSPLARLAEAQRQVYPDAMVPLADYCFTGGDGATRRYRLLMLR
jgi:hypothetical protein